MMFCVQMLLIYLFDRHAVFLFLLHFFVDNNLMHGTSKW